jgi:hypothetical protein
MWFKYSQLKLSAGYNFSEFRKRLKSITEEPKDIAEVVPMDIYKFKGVVGQSSIHLLYYGGAYLKALDVKIKVIDKNPVQIIVYYGFTKTQKYFNLFFLTVPFVVYLLKMGELLIDYEKLYYALVFLTFWTGVIVTWHIIYLFFAKRKLTKLFNYFMGNEFPEEKTKYHHF